MTPRTVCWKADLKKGLVSRLTYVLGFIGQVRKGGPDFLEIVFGGQIQFQIIELNARTVAADRQNLTDLRKAHGVSTSYDAARSVL